MEVLQITITVLSVILFLRVYWIQASSASLINMMKMKNKKLLTEIEFGGISEEMDRESVIEVVSYLNLVSKLYLNHSININMLRTFEGVMIKLLKSEIARNTYGDIFYDFRDNLKTAEPPYINLIYATNMLIELNVILNKRTLFGLIHGWFYRITKKIFFITLPSSKRNWEMARRVFESNDTNQL